jgi:hypothetical protein
MASKKPGQPVHCATCAHCFPQDPCFAVECPTCRAAAGSYCKRPSDHSGPLVPFHWERDLLALRRGFYDHAGTAACGPNLDSPRAKELLEGAHLPAKPTAASLQLPLF